MGTQDCHTHESPVVRVGGKYSNSSRKLFIQRATFPGHLRHCSAVTRVLISLA